MLGLAQPGWWDRGRRRVAPACAGSCGGPRRCGEGGWQLPVRRGLEYFRIGCPGQKGGDAATLPRSYGLCEVQAGTLFWGALSAELRGGGWHRLCDFWWDLGARTLQTNPCTRGMSCWKRGCLRGRCVAQIWQWLGRGFVALGTWAAGETVIKVYKRPGGDLVLITS